MATFDDISSSIDTGIRTVSIGVIAVPDPQDGTPGWSVYSLANGGVIEWTDSRGEVREIIARLGKLNDEWEAGYTR